MVRRENNAVKVHEPNKQSPDASADGTKLEAEANITYNPRSDFLSDCANQHAVSFRKLLQWKWIRCMVPSSYGSEGKASLINNSKGSYSSLFL